MEKPKKLTKAYSIKACNGPAGCPNALFKELPVINEITAIFEDLDYNDFIINKIHGALRIHHQFKVSISYCPNACSMPQISDLGIIAAAPVKLTDNQCTQCRACVDVCIEDAVILEETENTGPEIIEDKCVYCGKCAKVCPTETIIIKKKGFRIMVGGKLGRHPRLSTELPGIFSSENLLIISKKCIKFFMDNYSRAKRFADLFHIYNKNYIIEKLLP